jgi:endonuclease/exonuclease/phosphatase (EEP) superfamily protein YafD
LPDGSLHAQDASAGHSRPLRTPRVAVLVAALCWLYAAGAVAYWLVMRYAGDRWWPATVLLYAPRWPWLLPAVVNAPLAFLYRRRLAWLPLSTVLFVSGPFMGLCLPWRAALAGNPPGQHLRLLSCNAHRSKLHVGAFDELLLETDPDVVVLQDYSGWDASLILAHPSWHTRRDFELFIASKFPIRRVENLRLEDIPGEDVDERSRRTGNAIEYELELPNGTVRVVNLHLMSPHRPLAMLRSDIDEAARLLKAGSDRRANESALITSRLASASGPVILAGDFNMPAESPLWRQYWSPFTDAFEAAGTGYGYSYAIRRTTFRIDHVLASPGIVCKSCWLGRGLGSPHRPLITDVIIPGAR